MYCVKYFPWLKESAKGNGLLSSSTVALRVPHPVALVINQTTFHSQLERKDCHANMCLMLCLDVRETVSYMYCQNHSFEDELDEWIP